MASNTWIEWGKNVLDPLLLYPEEEGDALETLLTQPPAEVDLALLSADVDRTQAYVFESERLPEIRGASMLLTELSEGGTDLPDNIKRIFERHGLPQDCLVYAGGGSLLALVPHSVADKLQEEIEALYPTYTGAVTITCVYEKVSAREVIGGYRADAFDYKKLLALRERLNDQEWQRLADYYHDEQQEVGEITEEEFQGRKNFGEMGRLLEVRLRRKKQGKTIVPFHQAIPFAHRCSSCQIRPATRILDLHGEPRPVCRICEIKQENRREQKSRWAEEFEESLKEKRDERYYGEASPGQVDIPADLDEIGQTCLTKPGYIGFIYADGDGVGSFIKRQTCVSAHKENSEEIRRIIRQAVYRALAESLHPERVERKDGKGGVIPRPVIHPFEIITIGGDDVLLIVPGHVAVPLAVRICQLFQGEASYNLTMSAGVVIADAHNPVRFLRDLAEQLLKSAKRCARPEKEKGNITGALDFLVLRSLSMVRRDLKQLRRSAPYYYSLEDEGETEGLQLTACPYTLDEARSMLRLLIEFRRVDFPKSQLQALITALREGRHVSSLFYLYQQVRLRERGRVLAHLGEVWSLDPRTDLVPWQKVDQRTFRTPLPDLAELYDFVSSLSADELEEIWGEML